MKNIFIWLLIKFFIWLYSYYKVDVYNYVVFGIERFWNKNNCMYFFLILDC